MVEETLDGVISVVNWVRSELASDEDVEASVDDPAGNVGGTEQAQVWGVAGVQSRPRDGGEDGGYAKALRVQLGDTVVVIGTHDPRHVEPCEPGELVLHALGKDGGSRALIRLKPDGTIQLEGESIVVGQGAEHFAAMANLVDERLATVQQAFDLHTHPVSGSATGAPASPIGSLASVAAQKVKVE